jgi:hypothetical protein
VTRKLSLFLAALLVTASLSPAEQPQPYKIPVVCSVPHDTAEPAHPTPPHNTKPITEAEAQQIEKNGRTQSGFISMQEPENFGVLRYRLLEYATCRDPKQCYWNDLKEQTDHARAELKRLVAAHKGEEHLAMVLDIDETSLSNYCELQREGFGFIATQFNQFLVSPEGSIAIPGILELYNEALADKVSVFFITGRAYTMYDATTNDLHLAGYDHWSGLVLRGEDQLTTDTTFYKSIARARIVASGYRIILNVGDQWSDLNGSPTAEISIKLPNPFYFLP